MFVLRAIALLLTMGPFLCAEAEPSIPLQAYSWVESANDPSSDFPIQNLPYGVFQKKPKFIKPRICVAIGDYILDLKACTLKQLLGDLDKNTIKALLQVNLNDFMSLSREQQTLVRQRVFELLRDDNQTIQQNPKFKNTLLYAREDIDLLLPFHAGDYTDFYASIHHAMHVGSIMRPENPLMPNYKYMPIGYHGRSSSLVVSGTPIAWPSGQVLKSGGVPAWDFCQMLDYELEMGAVIGRGSLLGCPVPISAARQHIFGLVLLNDWSARDIQKWEYQPLGPFNGKNFGTTVSPWVVTLEALEPFKELPLPRSEEDPQQLDYLNSPSNQIYHIVVEAYLSSEKMRQEGMAPLLICRGNLNTLYWTFEQMVCHHTSSGCNLRAGDLLGSGTISGPAPDSLGCLLERAAFKMEPLNLPDGTTRTYLQNGDEISLRAYAQKEGVPRIGFGECRGIVSR